MISDACQTNCTSTVPLYSQTTFQSTQQQVQLFYGDSHTGTYASGPIGKDTAGVAGLTIQDQYLAAIVNTNTTVLDTGSAGIFGLGFPAIRSVGLPSRSSRTRMLNVFGSSVLWRQLLQAQLNSEPPSKHKRTVTDVNLRRPSFPSFDFLATTPPPHVHKRQNSTLLSSSEVIASFATYGPLFTRLISENALASPMFATTLQRDSVDIGGNVGQLSIGELPAGIQSGSLTWVPLREYTAQEGGLPPAPEAPNEVDFSVCCHFMLC